MEECIGFAEKSGMLKGKELEEAKKILPFIKSGETPGLLYNQRTMSDLLRRFFARRRMREFRRKSRFDFKEEADMARKTG